MKTKATPGRELGAPPIGNVWWRVEYHEARQIRNHLVTYSATYAHTAAEAAQKCNASLGTAFVRQLQPEEVTKLLDP